MSLGNVNGVRRVKVNRHQKWLVTTLVPKHPMAVEELIAALAANGYQAELA